MAKTMKAAQIVASKAPLEINEVPVPSAGPGQLLIKIHSSGVCHTDVHAQQGEIPVPFFPLTIGHEGCGEVVEVGAGVTNVKLGDRVGVPFLYSACGTCIDCRDGWETVCSEQTNTGLSQHGCVADYVVADAQYVCRIPDGLSYEQAAPIMCAGVTVYKALKVSEVKPGQYVVITGAAGGLGHVACQYAVAMGMKVIAVTRKLTSEKEEMFKKYGVQHTVDLSKETTAEGVLRITKHRGAEGMLCLSPDNKYLTDAVNYVARRGTIVPVAIPPGDMSLCTLLVVIKAIKVVGSVVGTRNDLDEALQFAADGKVVCKVTCRKYGDINEVINDLKDGKIAGRFVINM